MNKRINIAELADGMARRATIPVSFAEQFVQAFFKVIEEALMKDKLVKVKGLGTFKLVDVEARESVDVNTGERILLSAHSKVSFTPDASLRDTINRPFADFETVVLNDETPTEQMDTPDEATALDESQAKATAEEPATVKAEGKATAKAEEPAFKIAEATAKETPAKETAAEKHVAEKKAAALVATKNDTQKAAVENNDEAHTYINNKETKKTMSNIWKNILAAVACMFIGYAICYYLRPFELPTLSHSDNTEATTGQQATNGQNEEATEADATEAQAQQAEPNPADNYPQIEGADYEIVGVQGTETMSPGKTLLNISLKYFKSTDFVPYICKMNGIDNPDIVPLGKELQIPELKKK